MYFSKNQQLSQLTKRAFFLERHYHNFLGVYLENKRDDGAVRVLYNANFNCIGQIFFHDCQFLANEYKIVPRHQWFTFDNSPIEWFFCEIQWNEADEWALKFPYFKSEINERFKIFDKISLN